MQLFLHGDHQRAATQCSRQRIAVQSLELLRHCRGAAQLFPWQQESRSEIFENDTVGRYFPDNRTVIERCSLFVFAHIDEHESILGIAAVNMNVEMQVREQEYALRPQIIEGGKGLENYGCVSADH